MKSDFRKDVLSWHGKGKERTGKFPDTKASEGVLTPVRQG